MINRLEYHRHVQRHVEYEKQVVQKTVVEKKVHETEVIKQIQEQQNKHRIDVYV